MFGKFKKKKDLLVKFDMMGFTETALNSFDYFLIKNLNYKEWDTVSITPGTFRFNHLDDSFEVNFTNNDHLTTAMNVASYFSSNLDKFYKPVFH